MSLDLQTFLHQTGLSYEEFQALHLPEACTCTNGEIRYSVSHNEVYTSCTGCEYDDLTVLREPLRLKN